MQHVHTLQRCQGLQRGFHDTGRLWWGPAGPLLRCTCLNSALLPSAGKTRGMGAGRKLRLHRKDEKWADKDYKKTHLGSEWKKPFAGASHAKGIVLEKM